MFLSETEQTSFKHKSFFIILKYKQGFLNFGLQSPLEWRISTFLWSNNPSISWGKDKPLSLLGIYKFTSSTFPSRNYSNFIWQLLYLMEVCVFHV